MPGPQIAQRSMGLGNHLKVGLFGANCSSGRAATLVAERWSGDWQDCRALAQAADDSGIDFMLPVARWKGYGGPTNYQGSSLETVTWATGLLACTRRITVFGTVHAPLIHPVVAAKQFVTADHVGSGRFGLNVVCGWNEDEFEMFGVQQRDHERRYEFAQAWLDAVQAIWAGDNDFDIENSFFTLKGLRVQPGPVGATRPIIMNAGASATGRDFAVRNCDAFFTVADRDDIESSERTVKAAKAAAATYGRDIGIFTVGAVTCRPTRREAEDYYHHCMVDNADWAAVDGILRLRNMTRDNTPHNIYERARAGTANGLGQIQLVGTPDDIAGWLDNLHSAGLAGIGLSFVNYLNELPDFCQEVLPRLARLRARSGKSI